MGTMEQIVEEAPAAVQEATLTAQDRCDSKDCGAQAFVRAQFTSGPLFFCGHHYNKSEDKVKEIALEVIDERWRINVKPSQSSF